MSEHLNTKFRIPREQLEDRLHVGLIEDVQGYDTIIPLRDVKKITNLSFVKRDVLHALIRSIPLRRQGEVLYPYKEAKIEIFGVEPKGLSVGQTFVLDKKF